MKQMDGGVCAAKGFQAAGVYCGIRKNKNKKDLALIVSQVRAACACVYTQNLVQGAPITVTKANVADGYASAIICNSGNANTCNANGIEIAEGICKLAAKHLQLAPSDIIIASTGVIGQMLSLQPFENHMGELVSALGDHPQDAATAIMTTDTCMKEWAVTFELAGKTCTLGGMAKGSGMINPNMATMLVFLTTDAAISPAMLQKALSADTKDSFNMISVDGDTSTNDMCCIMANGMAGNPEITEEGPDFDAFQAALAAVTVPLCKMMAKDGEGATKLIECHVTGAVDKAAAATIAKTVIDSNLVKAAMFGSDANWGRVLCAIGYSGIDIDITKIDVTFVSAAGTIAVCKDGAGLAFSEEIAKTVLLEDEITIKITLNAGDATAIAWGCDLTYDYVKINGDYRS